MAPVFPAPRPSPRLERPSAPSAGAITPPTVTVFRKSSRSTNQTACVEVASTARVHGIRDSKNPWQSPLYFGTPEWTAFLCSVRRERL
ncbi:DUF397 domain-containing protein [Marinactinospora thermotolerans]|uniref:DUF397 domain-containing protein n=1 Tax=Marinactinospora thermotolerans DSM 45154 TaxID=1122192 RepID=A0A1T4SE95_9ACTN|nr:DUF397 domain-containing protein [Marinactinospora thermotolerans]SKA26495.1 protein of unknown function [Marinactinospora thermotolerans DSM 45154]